MNLQLALDRLSKQECMDILADTTDSIDWIEIGTGVIKEYGMEIVREVRAAYPSVTIVADMKTCDTGKHEAAQAFESGADITTVMAFSADQTITDTLKVAEDYSGRIMIDLLGIQDPERMEELSDLGVDLVSLHFGKDMQQTGELDDDLFSLVKDYPNLEVAVAGGINLESLPLMLKHNPDTFIVGSAITKQTNRTEIAAKMRGVLDEYEANNSHGRL
ncbi:3-hexulose-6-phosphate synthase [Halobacillus seohaensis]|uniref:3-hexulose-6-phosphate synthase n=1 Tax=Halobacillus seohaensis TaxID=447421 RepID=A0ABW2EM89_9BACI